MDFDKWMLMSESEKEAYNKRIDRWRFWTYLISGVLILIIDACFMAFLRLARANPEPGAVTRDKNIDGEIVPGTISRIYADDAKWAELVDVLRRLDDPNPRQPVESAPVPSAASS